MKKIALLAILAAFVAVMGIGPAFGATDQGETTATCGVDEVLEISAPTSVDLGTLDPVTNPCGDAYADANIKATVDWKLSVEDDTPAPGGDGYMRDSAGHKLTAQFEVDVGGGPWIPLPPCGAPVEMATGVPGDHTVETSYHQCVGWGDYSGDYTIVVTWIVEAA